MPASIRIVTQFNEFLSELCSYSATGYFKLFSNDQTALHYARKAFQGNPSFIINSCLVALADLAILSILIKCTSGKINCQLGSQGSGGRAAAIVMVMDKTQSSENYSNFYALIEKRIAAH